MLRALMCTRQACISFFRPFSSQDPVVTAVTGNLEVRCEDFMQYNDSFNSSESHIFL
uniref:Secreted protein n=1 Tax=Heterorhabditis bacteriophora TaxID=37862 RepID=A0A1I7WPL4_HETBA